jgi:hypothetical protein
MTEEDLKTTCFLFGLHAGLADDAICSRMTEDGAGTTTVLKHSTDVLNKTPVDLSGQAASFQAVVRKDKGTARGNQQHKEIVRRGQ